MTEKNEKRVIEVPRRQFIAGVGKFAAGAAVGMGALGLVGCSSTETAQAEGENTSAEGAASKVELPAWPWPYKKLDSKVVAKRAYENYFKGGCMFAVGSALIQTLHEEVGDPYNFIPVEMYKYGSGGAAGWGTLCGSLNGACSVINLVCKDFGAVCNEVIGWYTKQPFPSTDHDEYAKFKGQETTVSNSPLCHNSVSKWCNKTGAKIGDPERKDRCAKLSGDVAAKTVELLNAYADGAFAAAYKAEGEYTSCFDCHSNKTNIISKMDCFDCHDDPHK